MILTIIIICWLKIHGAGIEMNGAQRKKRKATDTCWTGVWPSGTEEEDISQGEQWRLCLNSQVYEHL